VLDGRSPDGYAPAMRTGRRLALVAAILACVASPPAWGQEIRGRVVERATGEAVMGGFAVLVDEGGLEMARSLTDARGAFALLAPGPGTYRIRSERIGFRVAVSDLIDLADNQVVEDYTLAVEPILVQLDAITVEGDDICRVRPEEGMAAATVWEEIRKALAATRWLEQSRLLTYQIFKYRRELKPDLRVEREAGNFEVVSASRPFHTEDPALLEADGYVRIERGDAVFFGPDAHLLLSDPFLDGHCFRLMPSEDGSDHVGLTFVPLADSVPNLTGVLWVDRASAELRRLEFTFVNLPISIEVKHMGGEVTFRRTPDGAWVATAWYLRAPVIRTRGARPFRRQYLDGYVEEGAELVEIMPPDSP
jgi:hypothetical protein